VPIDWERIVVEHGQMVFQAAMRILGHTADAEDVAQEVFMEVYSHVPADVRNWGPYLRKLAVFRALDRRRQRREVEPLSSEACADAEGSPYDEAVLHESAERLRTLIAALPEREGAVFSLRYFEHLTNPQIAEVLGISTAAVAAAVYKVRMKLESSLSNSSKGDAK
jgi:RNA polymerase sigma-70 factor (ECF subfamily)